MSHPPLSLLILRQDKFDFDTFEARETRHRLASNDTIRRVAQAVADDMADRFGVFTRRATVYLISDRITIVFDIEAGEWRRQYRFSTSTLMGWEQRLRFRILRLVEENNEELG